MKTFLAALLVVLSGCECECAEWSTRPARRCVRSHYENQYAFSYTDGRYHNVQARVCDEYESYDEEYCRSYK